MWWWWAALFVTMHAAPTLGLSLLPTPKKWSAGQKQSHDKNVQMAAAAVKRGGKVDVMWLVSLSLVAFWWQ
jgi:hypothetical protein